MSESPAPENAPAPATPDISALNQRLEDAQTQLASLRGRVRRSSIISTIIGLLLLLLLTGYFTYGYVEILRFINKPEELVSYVGLTVENYLPQAREELETTIVESAPDLAKMASEEFLNSAPDIRQRLEETIFDQTKTFVDELAGFTAEEFKQFLVEQRPTLQASIEELSSSHKPPDKTMEELTAALEDELQMNMQEQADSLLHALYDLNEKLKKLAEGGHGLTREESYERRALMILRRVQLEQADPDFVGKKWTVASRDEAPPVEETPDKPDEKPEPGPAKEAEPGKAEPGKAERKTENTPAPEANKETKPKDKAPAADDKKEAKPKDEAPAPEPKDEMKAEAPAPKPKDETKPKAEAPAPEAKEEEEAKPKAEPDRKAKEEPKPKTESPATEPEKPEADEPQTKPG